MEVDSPSRAMSMDVLPEEVEMADSGPEESDGAIPVGATTAGAHVGHLSELSWPELGGLDLTKVHKFALPKGKRKKTRTSKDEHYDVVISNSPYGKFVGPSPVRPQITPAQIARRRMEKVYQKLGMAPPGKKGQASKPSGPGETAAGKGPAAGVTGSGAVGQDAQTAEDFADMAESFGPQTLQSWLAEVDGLRVALDRSLSNETSTGEVTYPLLQEVPQVLEDVKAQVKAYTLPKYKHGRAGEEAAEQGPSKGEAGGGAAPVATTVTAPLSLSATGGKAVEQQPAAGSVERAAARTLSGALSPLATSGKDPGITTAASPNVGSPTYALSPSAGKGLSTSGRLGSMSPKSPSRGGAMTPVSRAGQRRRREENETRPSSRARLSTFLDSLEAAHVLSRDDVNNFFAPLPLEPSSEMDEQMKELLEKHLGTGPWQDIVASTLARPLDSELVFCDEAAQLGNATVAVRLGSPVAEGEGGGEGKEPLHLTVHTSVSSTLPIIENFPRTEFLQRLAEEHRREGRIQEAIACLQEASALLEQKQVILPMAQAGQLFPYTHETFRAARIVQRLGRRRLRAKHAASTVIASRFRGFMARRGGLLLRVKRKVGAKIIQHQYRQHYGRRIRAAVNVQKIARGWKGRRDVLELRKQIKGAVVLQAVFRMFKAKLRVKAMRHQQVCAVRLQSLYRGFFVRLVRHRHIALLHAKWARCVTAVNRHVRGWLGRRQAALALRRRIATEFDRRQAELDVLRASTLLATRRCHWYLQTAEGKMEITMEKHRLKTSGRFRRTTLAPFQLVDKDHLMAGLRPLFELYDVSGSGYLCRSELHGLLHFLGIGNRDAEATSALLLSDDACGRRLSFQGFCAWYHGYFRYGPGTLGTGLSHSIQRRAMPFAQRTILRRRCLPASRDVSHDTHQLQPAPSLQCIQCRKPFLHYRAFMAHFVGAPDEAVHGPRHLCPVTGGIGLISLGYLGGYQAFSFQRRVNTELMRYLDETAALELATRAAEAKTLADLRLPQPSAELETLTRALQVAYPPATLRRNARRDAIKRRLLPGQLRHQKRFVIGHNAPRARRLVAPINRHLGFAYLQRKRALATQEQWAIRRRKRAHRARRAWKKLLARRPCPRPIVQAVFDVYCIDKRGLHVRDLRDLCDALQLRFTSEAKALLTPLSLKATFAPGPATRVDFDTFYRWYVASNGLLFHNGFKVSRAKMPRYLAECLLLRRAVQTARATAMDDFRTKRPACLEWSASELCTVEQHARRHPEFRCLLPDTDQDLAQWLQLSREWAATRIETTIREKWAPRSRQPWWQRVLCGRRGIAVGSDAGPSGPMAVAPIHAAGLGLRHAEAEARRYITTVYGRMAQRLQVDRWQLEAIRAQRRQGPASCRRPGLWRSFLQARREMTGLPTPGGEEKEARPLQRLAGVLVTHDPDGHGRVLWETVPQLVQDLDLSAEPPGVSYDLIQKLSYLRSNQLRYTRSHVEEDQRVSDAFCVWADDLYEALRQGLTSGVPLRRRGRRFPDASLLTLDMWLRNRAARSLVVRGRMTAAQPSPAAEAINARTAQVKTEAEREWLSRDARGLAQRAFAEAVSRPEARLLVKGRVLYLQALRSAYAKVGVRRGEGRRWWVVDYCFHLLDPERRGYIDAWQLGSLVSTLGLHMSRNELTLVLESALDPQGSGRVALSDLQAWLEGDGRRHYRSMRSRLLQLRRRLREALGLHVRGDAIFSLLMETLRDRERALRSLFACEDGDVAALEGIKPWNRHQPVRCDKDLHTLLSLESVSTADVHLLVQDTELGPILTEAHRRQLEGRREALLRVEEDPVVHRPGMFKRLRSWWHFMKRPTLQHEEALAKHSDDILGVEASYALSDRMWLEIAGARLKQSRLSRHAWTRDSIETTIHRSTLTTDTNSYSGVQRLLEAKYSIVSPESRLARLSWVRRVRNTALDKLWRRDELQEFFVLSRGLCYELAGLRPGKEDTEARARADILLRMQALAQQRADALLKTFIRSFRGRQELRELEQQLACKWEGLLALQPTAHAFTLLEGHVQEHAIHACDVPLVVHFIFGRCKQARALMHWVNGITLTLRLSDSGKISIGLLQALCEGSPVPFSPSTRYVQRQYTPRNFVALILSLHFRQMQREAISHAITDERIVNEFFTQAQAFLSEVKDE